MVNDQDAPTLSSWRHWQLVNIPADITVLKAGTVDGVPKGARQLYNDYGGAGFG